MKDRRTDTLLRVKQVKARTNLSEATIYRRTANGTFPPKQEMGPKMVGWYETDVGEWIADPKGYRAPGFEA